ncbi:MAG: hypothetical protein JWL90_3182 [Chthoniobacteraceae bacterium]|nr:hypothetical protein [Chthoniobacteraceae bacterium]
MEAPTRAVAAFNHLQQQPIGRRGRHGRGSSRRGRLLLVAIFFVLRSTDLLMYFGSHANNRAQLLSPIIAGGIWTTALLIAIGCRQNWARYILNSLLVLSVIFSFVGSLILLQEGTQDHMPIAMLLIVGLVNAGLFWCLLLSPSIRRLAKRA